MGILSPQQYAASATACAAAQNPHPKMWPLHSLWNELSSSLGLCPERLRSWGLHQRLQHLPQSATCAR